MKGRGAREARENFFLNRTDWPSHRRTRQGWRNRGGRSGYGRTNLNTELKIFIYISFLNPKEVAVTMFARCIYLTSITLILSTRA